jgi:hypothetical protein
MERENQERLLCRGLGIAGALLTLGTSCYSYAWQQSRTKAGGWGAESLTVSPDYKFVTGVMLNYESDSKKASELWIWDVQTGKRLSRHKLESSYSPPGVQFAPTGRYILYKNTLYTPQSTAPALRLPRSNVKCIFSPDEKRLLLLSNNSSASDTYLTAWDISGQRQLWRKRTSPGRWLETLTLPEQGGFVVRYRDHSELWTASSSKPKLFPPTHRFPQVAAPLGQSLLDTFQGHRVVASPWGNALKHEPIGKIVDARTRATLVTLEGTTGW